MKKILSLVVALGVALGAFSGPATAGKKKKPVKVSETFAVQAYPFPNPSGYTATERRSCFAGEEGIHWAGQEFTAPGKGDLTASMEGFTGDWDLAIAIDDATWLYSVNDQTQADAAEERLVLPLTKGQTVQILACNYAAPPDAEVSYSGTFK